MSESKKKDASTMMPSTLWFFAGGRGPRPSIPEFEHMQNGDWEPYIERSRAQRRATDEDAAGSDKKSSSSKLSSFFLPLSTRNIEAFDRRATAVARAEAEKTKRATAEAEELVQLRKEKRALERKNKKLRAKLAQRVGEEAAAGANADEDAASSSHASSDDESGSDSDSIIVVPHSRKGKAREVHIVPPSGEGPSFRYVPARTKKKQKMKVRIVEPESS